MLIHVSQVDSRQIPRIALRRGISTLANLSTAKAPAYVFHSTSKDPYLNLSIEHYIFQNCPARTRVLFLYVNRPCVVIGRNQNPWVEVNLSNLERGLRASNQSQPIPIDLVRRRSGGGTVFHDEGNVNWSVLCDLNEFSRDKHAEMVVRGLRKLAIDRARVNERHDIVLDQGDQKNAVIEDDLHVSPYTQSSTVALKVSGSAYKIAKNRALHHGTALVESPNLNSISDILRSPARIFIKAKGVESVRSSIANLAIPTKVFESTTESEFRRLYKVPQDICPIIHLGESCLEIESIRNGYEELKVGLSNAKINSFGHANMS
jgi:lipoate---protein ligase